MVLKVLLTILLNWNSQVQCVSDVVYGEARGEPLLGQIAVIDVVLNRAVKQRKDLCSVTREHGQFYAYRTPSRNTSMATSAIWSYIYGIDASNGASYFHSGPIRKNIQYKVHIGGHHFY